MKNYLKPEVYIMNVSALEGISATFSSFDSFSGLTESITTYQFGSGLNSAGGAK